tara:strand:+ start:1536 stop:2516 length:981 start_codon:yes stop_codon:yes gene_type:complete
MIDFKDPQIRYLIDFANIRTGIIKYQNDFLNKEQLDNFFKNEHCGFPLLLPTGIKYFIYDKNFTFRINKKKVLKKIFKIKKNNYVGFKIFFKYGNKFAYNVKLKKKYTKQFNYINNFNNNLIKKIRNLKKSTYISAFQTRNIPHYGHEKIIKRLIKKKGVVFINPLVGVKKNGDYKNEILKKIFLKLIKTKEYKNKLFYGPVIANMHYGGPREAIHHINIREKIGFSRFAIGRDHAGAENAYKSLDSFKLAKKYSKKFNIHIFFHKGSYFCEACNKIVLKDDCEHKILKEISGSDFRKKILEKKLFLYASKSLQNYIHKLKNKLFY